MILLGFMACTPSQPENQYPMTQQHQTAGAVEITTFQLNPGVSTTDFILSARQMQNDFLQKQEGFIKRTLTLSGDSLWTDIVFWVNKESHNKAMLNAEKTASIFPFMEKINFNSVKMNLTHPVIIEE